MEAQSGWRDEPRSETRRCEPDPAALTGHEKEFEFSSLGTGKSLKAVSKGFILRNYSGCWVENGLEVGVGERWGIRQKVTIQLTWAVGLTLPSNNRHRTLLCAVLVPCAVSNLHPSPIIPWAQKTCSGSPCTQDTVLKA